MASDDVVERIVKLLRQAADSDGTTEGDNAAARASEIARKLMEKHGVQVILGDIPPEEQPRSREVGESFGLFDSREIWLEELAHGIGWIFDVTPVWYWHDTGQVGLVVFDPFGDADRLQRARHVFDDVLRTIYDRQIPGFLRLERPIEPSKARRIFRAGMSQTVVSRLASSGRVPRPPDPELPANEDVVALVPIRVHRRPRNELLDCAMDVPLQGNADEWAKGDEAKLFAWGVDAGYRVFLPVIEGATR